MTLALMRHEEGCNPFHRCRACAAADLLATSSKEVREIFGIESDTEFELGVHLPDCSPIRPCRNCEAVLVLRTNLGESKFKRLLDLLDDSKSLEEYRREQDPTLREKLLKPIIEMEFSVRTDKCLRDENIRFVGQLCYKTENELLRVPNFGRKSLNEVKEVLYSMGLRLCMDIPEDVIFPD